MPAPRLPILWLAGAPGSGKSTTAWRAFIDSVDVPMGYVDIDQLGMIYPEPAGDPGRERTKALALRAVVGAHAEAGVQQLLVSGVIDPDALEPVRQMLAGLGELTICDLRVAEPVLRSRLERRGWPETQVEAALREQRELDGAALDARVDVEDLSVEDVAMLLRPFMAGAGRDLSTGTPDRVQVDAPLILVTGPRAVGKSTVAWELFQRRIQAGQRTAFLDLGQLGFAHLPGAVVDRLRVQSALAVAQVLGGQGATAIVVNGTLTESQFVQFRKSAGTTVIRLTATPADIRSRVARRAADGGPGRLAGDDLFGADQASQEIVIEQSLAEAERHRDAEVAGIIVSTSDRTIGEIVDEVRLQLG